ncbi:MAG: type II toxin-antitoxin system prevent-host-death family antitoxin [Synergistaceae bacterium]|jgi:prevent-host-death family protein|nr:type II toxin-antitoxin system prevent-host-death family antitoxin [Synergistaceae bacterium]
MQMVGMYETKNKLSAIVNQVCEGESFIVTRHGVPVATINPVEDISNVKEVVAAIRAQRKEFIEALKGIDIKELIEEGRR